MTGIPRPIVQTERPCALCGTALVITFDALNRPRHRCPTCHGAVTTPIDAGTVARVATPEPGLELVPPSRQQLQRMAQTVRPMLAPRHPAATSIAGVAAAAITVRWCARCGAPLPQRKGPGRPRVRCEDARACAGRTRVAV